MSSIIFTGREDQHHEIRITTKTQRHKERQTRFKVYNLKKISGFLCVFVVKCFMP